MGRTAKQITAREIKTLRHSAKDGKRATRYGLGETRFYLWVYPTNKKEFYYKSISGQWHKLGELTELYTRERAKQDYSKLYAQDALNLLEKTPKQRATAPTLKQCYDELFTQAYALRGEVGTREYENDLRKRKDAKKRLPKWILQPLGDKLLSELNAQILINNFTKNPDELPTRETTKKCLIVFKTLLKQAKIRGLIDDLAFIDQARSELKELITEGENTKTVHSAYIVSVYVDGSGNMVLVKNPTITNIPKKSSYKPKAIESEGTVDSITTNEINEFLTTFFKLYPTATASELSYYVNDGILKPIGKEYIFQELVNPIHNRKDNQVTVSLTVEYIDQQTKATQVSQFDLVLEKNGSNWKIIE